MSAPDLRTWAETAAAVAGREDSRLATARTLAARSALDSVRLDLPDQRLYARGHDGKLVPVLLTDGILHLTGGSQ